MLYYRPPLMTQLADKFAVRPYVAERVGPHILNELYGVWDRVADLDFARSRTRSCSRSTGAGA